MYQLGMARISSRRTTRASYFSEAAVDSFAPGRGAPGLGAQPHPAYPALGQAQGYYDSAKTAIAVYDSLVARLQKVANQTARDQIAVQFGLTTPTDNTKAQYMRDALAYDVSVADSSTVDQGFPPTGPSRGRIIKLQSFNNDFEAAVKNAENTYGVLPAPQQITNYVTTQNPLNWILPVVAVGAGFVIAGALGLFGKK
jgi:hypothetical protein